MILAEPPIHLPPAVKVTHLPVPPLPEEQKDVPRFGRQWPEMRVNNFHYPYLVFVFEGEADLRVGTTASMAKAAKIKNAWTRNGCHVLHLPAPSFLILPPGVPYSDGSGLHWERSEPQPLPTNILWIHLLPTGALCHLCTTSEKHHHSEHPLLVNDEKLPPIIHLLKNELENRALDYELVAQSQLVSFLLRLRRCLTLDEPVIGNTAWLPEPRPVARAMTNESEACTHQIIENADEYIQTHLNEPLKLGQIASHCGVSPTHLNRVFNAMMGVSTKRYVNRQRIRASAVMLEKTEMSIKEISRLVGFTQVSHFCQVFAKTQHMSPTQYRDQVRNSRPL